MILAVVDRGVVDGRQGDGVLRFGAVGADRRSGDGRAGLVGEGDEQLEVGDLLVEGAVDPDAQRGDPAALVLDEAVADERGRSDEVGAEADLDRHACRRGVAIARGPETLDLGDVVAVALAGERVVVEVLRRRAHGAERERVAVGVAAAGGRDRIRIVVGEFEADRDDTIDVVERASGADAAPSRIGSKKASAVAGKNELPIQPSASSPVRRRLAGPSEAT